MDCKSPILLLAETTSCLSDSPSIRAPVFDSYLFQNSPAKEKKSTSAFDIVKSSPRMDLLMQVAENSEKQKKKRQPPNPVKKSTYRGVSWQKTSKAWVAQYKSGGKTTYLGLFATEEDAAKAYDVAVYLNGGKNLNFGVPSQEAINQFKANGNVPAGRLGATISKRVEEKAKDTDSKLERGATSHYRGVSWYASRQIWKASIQVNRKKEYIGRFETEEEAARAYNRRAQELRGSEAILNIVPDTVTRFPPSEMNDKPPRPEKAKKERKKKRQSDDSDSAGPAEYSTSTFEAKKQKMDPTSLPSSFIVPPTPTINDLSSPGLSHFIDTPQLGRLPDTPQLVSRLSGRENDPNQRPTVTKMTPFDDAEMAAALGSFQQTFDSPTIFTSPVPVSNKRLLDPLSSAMVPSFNNNVNSLNNYTPSQNVFDSPVAPDYPPFTPSDVSTSANRFSFRKSLITP